MKRLIIDVDDVLRNTTKQVLKVYNRDYKINGFKTLDDIIDFDLNKVLGINNEQFFRNNAKELFYEAEPNNFSKTAMNILHQKYDIVIATAQFKGLEKYTIDWLHENLIPYNSIVFTRDKHKLQGDVLVDDGMHNLDKFEGLTICYDKPWNRNKRYDYRVDDMLEVNYILKLFEKE